MPHAEIDWTRIPHAEPLRQMFDRLRGLERCVVAYSGGVDSALLLKVGALALGENCIGLIARSETLTDQSFVAAQALATDHGLELRVMEYSELDIEGYADNPLNRCYFCKHELFTRALDEARRLGIHYVLDGSNADDVGDYRPGMQAAAELEVISPLRDAGLTKQQVRDISQALGLPNWDAPSSPCLSSRVAYGVPIDEEKLRQIAEGEAWLRDRGFRQVRVRHHGDLARVEVEPAEMDRLLARPMREELAAFLRELGFRHVTVDLVGYRMGSLNEGVVPEQSGTNA